MVALFKEYGEHAAEEHERPKQTSVWLRSQNHNVAHTGLRQTFSFADPSLLNLPNLIQVPHVVCRHMILSNEGRVHLHCSLQRASLAEARSRTTFQYAKTGKEVFDASASMPGRLEAGSRNMDMEKTSSMRSGVWVDSPRVLGPVPQPRLLLPDTERPQSPS